MSMGEKGREGVGRAVGGKMDGIIYQYHGGAD